MSRTHSKDLRGVLRPQTTLGSGHVSAAGGLGPTMGPLPPGAGSAIRMPGTRVMSVSSIVDKIRVVGGVSSFFLSPSFSVDRLGVRRAFCQSVNQDLGVPLFGSVGTTKF